MEEPGGDGDGGGGGARVGTMLRTLQQAVLHHQYSLFDAASRDEIDARFHALPEAERVEQVALIRSHLARRDVEAARAVLHRLAEGGPLPGPRTVAALRFALATLVVLLAPLRIAFGPTELELAVALDALIFAAYPLLLTLGVTMHTVDAICMLPLGTLAHVMFGAGRELEALRLLALIPLSQSVRPFIRSATQRISVLLLIMVLSAHVLGCVWYAVSAHQGFATEWGAKPELAAKGFAMCYFSSFYWALQSLAGGPDALPSTGLELGLSIFILFLGWCVYATIIGSIGSLLLSLDSDNQQWLDKLGSVERYINNHRLPLAVRVRSHYTALRTYGKPPSDDGLFRELPTSLQVDISLYLLSDLLSKVDFLKGAPPHMLSLIARMLQPQSIGPGERVVTEGESGSTMFFVMKGLLEVIIGAQVVGCLSAGDAFGEMSLFLAQPRTATVQAVTFCDVFELTKSDLDEVLTEFPSIAEALEDKMHERIQGTTELKGLEQRAQQYSRKNTLGEDTFGRRKSINLEDPLLRSGGALPTVPTLSVLNANVDADGRVKTEPVREMSEGALNRAVGLFRRHAQKPSTPDAANVEQPPPHTASSPHRGGSDDDD